MLQSTTSQARTLVAKIKTKIMHITKIEILFILLKKKSIPMQIASMNA